MRKQIMISIWPIHIYIICCHKLSILYVLLVVGVHPKQHCWKKIWKLLWQIQSVLEWNSKCLKKLTNFLYMVQISSQEKGFFLSYFFNSQIWLNWQDWFTPQLYHKIENKIFLIPKFKFIFFFFLMNHFYWPFTNEF
jgi:hypothetical protein